MEKQLKKIETSLKKVSKGIKRTLDGEFKNSENILSYLNKRERILERTKEKILKFNKKHLIKWCESKKTFIS